ncbi:hypothetical protein V6N11_039201 [Hibiscus sabdariffa]|uniref:Uncharacterized protein n=1 Tax=Hibiscus sabdariffa TaxID=183260 RepID=A0ABR2SMU6_9ROSI
MAFLASSVLPSNMNIKGKGLEVKWQILEMSGFCVVFKKNSAHLAIQTRVFLLHVVNCGLMQVLRLWRCFEAENGGDLFSMKDEPSSYSSGVAES